MTATPDLAKAQDYTARTITMEVENLDRELADLIREATDWRERLRNGYRVGSGLGAVVTTEAVRVERTAAKLDALLNVGNAILTDEAINAAYGKPFPKP